MGSLSQPRLNIFAVGNMRVMICLGQGGLRSLSASSMCIQCNLLIYIYMHSHKEEQRENNKMIPSVCKSTYQNGDGSKKN